MWHKDSTALILTRYDLDGYVVAFIQVDFEMRGSRTFNKHFSEFESLFRYYAESGTGAGNNHCWFTVLVSPSLNSIM